MSQGGPNIAGSVQKMHSEAVGHERPFVVPNEQMSRITETIKAWENLVESVIAMVKLVLSSDPQVTTGETPASIAATIIGELDTMGTLSLSDDGKWETQMGQSIRRLPNNKFTEEKFGEILGLLSANGRVQALLARPS